jgi:hypothetical protein
MLTLIHRYYIRLKGILKNSKKPIFFSYESAVKNVAFFFQVQSYQPAIYNKSFVLGLISLAGQYV